MSAEYACSVCSAATTEVATIPSPFSGRSYHLRQCRSCWFAFVANPWTEWARIYDQRYYDGRGADPNVDYTFEHDHPDTTVRQYEWRGILGAVSALTPVTPTTRWLDYGCGHGGLVRFLAQRSACQAFGYDTGAMADTARTGGLAILTPDDLAAGAGRFDVVTAIEVIEHVPDPVAWLRDLRALLRPGGLLFLTTGNARPFRERLPAWSYVLPDVHVSFFEPLTLARAFETAGFTPAWPGFLAGWRDIIRFKALKAYRVRERNAAERLIPWRVAARVIDRRLGVTAHPVGWAR